MKSLLAVFYESHKANLKAEFLMGRLNWHGISWRAFGYGFRGFGEKIRAVYQAVCDHADKDYVLFLDSRDTLPLADNDVIIERFESLGVPWVFNAEVAVWPPDAVRQQRYGERTSPWWFLNSGMHMGSTQYMRETLERWGAADVPYRVDDQAWYADHFLDEPDVVHLDRGCKLFQTLMGWWDDAKGVPNDQFTAGDGRLHNNVMDSDPLLLHWNGGGDIQKAWEVIRADRPKENP